MCRERAGREVYAESIKEELNVEDTRRPSSSLGPRALIATSETLVTFSLGPADLAGGTKIFVLPIQAPPLLLVNLGLFLLASAMAIMTNAPLRYPMSRLCPS